MAVIIQNTGNPRSLKNVLRRVNSFEAAEIASKIIAASEIKQVKRSRISIKMLLSDAKAIVIF
ncbi:MAG: hypothetical protein KBG60_07185 [Anaerolineaceae bacterium]|nr:hypothetical protein [Anaerolineaceae bacterium]